MGSPMSRSFARPLAAALLVAAALPAAGASRQVIEDDYPRALEEARRRDVPILVDVWAPW
jgi:hypothetical protein